MHPHPRFADADAAAASGMSISWVAAQHPEWAAILHERRDLSFVQLNERANQFARALRAHGLRAGDGVAVLLPNRPEFAELYFAVLRSGLRLTPINWHLHADEVAYIADDCEARVLVADVRFAATARAAAEAAGKLSLRLAVGGAIEGFRDLEEFLAGHAGADIDDPVLGDTMLYTSGTTGRPKGVRRPPPDPPKAVLGAKLIAGAFGFRPDDGDTSLATGPLYHSGPINLCLQFPLSAGVPVVLMEKWDAEDMLRRIAAHHITHTFCVPTMFHRLLALPEAVRARHDVSSLRFVIHGAAPCPVEDKRAMIEWFGPILTEIFAATEGPGTMVTSEEWLAKPGTVGRPAPGGIRIVGSDGEPVPAGEDGTIYLRAAAGSGFEYFKSPEKTRDALDGDFYSVGDVGHLDEDGYLFLTGRSAELILIGGTNIYPAEIDDAILSHPAVRDAAAVGAPNQEWGEEVRAVVALEDPAAASEELAEAILEHCRARLPTIKVPRRVDFEAELPRSDAGKLYRKRLRARYWPD